MFCGQSAFFLVHELSKSCPKSCPKVVWSCLELSLRLGFGVWGLGLGFIKSKNNTFSVEKLRISAPGFGVWGLVFWGLVFDVSKFPSCHCMNAFFHHLHKSNTSHILPRTPCSIGIPRKLHFKEYMTLLTRTPCSIRIPMKMVCSKRFDSLKP